MKSVKWTLAAQVSYDVLVRYIALEQPKSARVLAGKVTKFTHKLEQFPKLGKRIENKFSSEEYREIILYPCRLIYKIEEKYIFIVELVRTERLFSLKLLLP